MVQPANNLPEPDVVSIRHATLADVPAVASIHVRSWQAAYRGIVPDAILEGLVVSERERTWARILDGAESERVWVAQLVERVVGFASTGPSRDKDASTEIGEVYTIYMDPERTGRGIGRILLAHAAADLAGQGYREATLWVLTENVGGRRFYEAVGWQPDGATQVTVDGHEVRYRVTLDGSGLSISA